MQKNNKFIFASTIFLLFSLVSCAPAIKYTDEEKAYLERVKKHKSTLYFSKNSVDLAWSRAREFVSKYGKIKTENELLIEARPERKRNLVGYKIEKQKHGDGYNIITKVIIKNIHAIKIASNNAAILREYILTGELLYPHLVFDK